MMFGSLGVAIVCVLGRVMDDVRRWREDRRRPGYLYVQSRTDKWQ